MKGPMMSSSAHLPRDPRLAGDVLRGSPSGQAPHDSRDQPGSAARLVFEPPTWRLDFLSPGCGARLRAACFGGRQSARAAGAPLSGPIEEAPISADTEAGSGVSLRGHRCGASFRRARAIPA